MYWIFPRQSKAWLGSVIYSYTSRSNIFEFPPSVFQRTKNAQLLESVVLPQTHSSTSWILNFMTLQNRYLVENSITRISLQNLSLKNYNASFKKFISRIWSTKVKIAHSISVYFLRLITFPFPFYLVNNATQIGLIIYLFRFLNFCFHQKPEQILPLMCNTHLLYIYLWVHIYLPLDS